VTDNLLLCKLSNNTESQCLCTAGGHWCKHWLLHTAGGQAGTTSRRGGAGAWQHRETSTCRTPGRRDAPYNSRLQRSGRSAHESNTAAKWAQSGWLQNRTTGVLLTDHNTVTKGGFNYRIRIQFHGETSFIFTWQIEWPFSRKQRNPWYVNNSDVVWQVSPNLNSVWDSLIECTFLLYRKPVSLRIWILVQQKIRRKKYSSCHLLTILLVIGIDGFITVCHYFYEWWNISVFCKWDFRELLSATFYVTAIILCYTKNIYKICNCKPHPRKQIS